MQIPPIKSALFFLILANLVCGTGTLGAQIIQDPFAWPEIRQEAQPWTRWWWHGSSVTREGITAEMEAYRRAGIGGLELTPIFGTIGDEANFIDFLSPKWMDMLEFTLQEAKRLGLGVDMATGTGWPFGGPWVNDADACKYVAYKTFTLNKGESLPEPVTFEQKPILRVVPNAPYQKYVQNNPQLPQIPAWIAQKRPPAIGDITDPVASNKNLQAMAIDQVRFPKRLPPQALIAYSSKGKMLDLTANMDEQGHLQWKAPKGTWTLYAVFQGNHGKMVERAAPGGEGNVIDHFSTTPIQHYLARFDQAFQGRDLTGLRAFFNDSYEVDDAQGQGDWTPELFDAFQKRRGYDLRSCLPALFGNDDSEKNLRVRSDYRQTISDLLLDTFTKKWSAWANTKGKIIRNQGHGSPANILDLYAASGIPETEGTDIIKIKFASSAAHVAGKTLAAAEAATWLNEHFRSNLAHLKENLDHYFLGGINHVVYHGTSYSPPGEPWPGRLFYAAIHANPRNSLWNDLGALNQYAARTQAFLQSGQPDNDILVYFPIFDAFAHPSREMLQHFDGGEKGMDGMTLKAVADTLQNRGFAFDFISDNQILGLEVRDGKLYAGGNAYRAILLPECRFIPLDVMEKLSALARSGGLVLAHRKLPLGVPGFGELEKRQERFSKLIQEIGPAPSGAKGLFGIGTRLEPLLNEAGVQREPLTDQGLQFVRRRIGNEIVYFIANWSGKDQDGWTPLSAAGKSVLLFDPMTGKTGIAQTRPGKAGQLEVRIQLEHGAGAILKVSESLIWGTPWGYFEPSGPSIPLDGVWKTRFMEGGPEIPDPYETPTLGSWTTLGGSKAERFSGTARYSLAFNRPSTGAKRWKLDLGNVAETARVWLNGKEMAVLTGPRYTVIFEEQQLMDTNVLEVYVSNLMANRIADMDKKGVPWKKFYNTNFPARLSENRNKEGLFDASGWQPLPSGLLGPVTLTPAN